MLISYEKKIINAICLVVMLGIVIYHTNLKINNQDCIFLRTSQFPIAIYNLFVYFMIFNYNDTRVKRSKPT